MCQNKCVYSACCHAVFIKYWCYELRDDVYFVGQIQGELDLSIAIQAKRLAQKPFRIVVSNENHGGE